MKVLVALSDVCSSSYWNGISDGRFILEGSSDLLFSQEVISSSVCSNVDVKDVKNDLLIIQNIKVNVCFNDV